MYILECVCIYDAKVPDIGRRTSHQRPLFAEIWITWITVVFLESFSCYLLLYRAHLNQGRQHIYYEYRYIKLHNIHE